MTQTINTSSKLIETINREEGERLQDEVTALVKHYIDNCEDSCRVSCGALCVDLLGEQAYKVSDEIFYMKSTFRDLLALPTDPEVAKKFKKLRARSWSDDFAQHLTRMLLFLDRADNSLARAEMIYAELEIGAVDISRLKEWKREYSQKINS